MSDQVGNQNVGFLMTRLNFFTVYKLPIVNKCWYEMSYGTEEEEEEEDRKKRAKKDKEEEEKREEEEVEYEEVEGEEEEGMSEEGTLFVEYGLVLLLIYFPVSCFARKPVFGVSDQVQHKPGCTS